MTVNYSLSVLPIILSFLLCMFLTNCIPYMKRKRHRRKQFRAVVGIHFPTSLLELLWFYWQFARNSAIKLRKSTQNFGREFFSFLNCYKLYMPTQNYHNDCLNFSLEYPWQTACRLISQDCDIILQCIPYYNINFCVIS